jgi:hypothetical protein
VRAAAELCAEHSARVGLSLLIDTRSARANRRPAAQRDLTFPYDVRTMLRCARNDSSYA